MNALDDAPPVPRTTPRWMTIVGWVLTLPPALMMSGMGTAMLLDIGKAEKGMKESGYPPEYAAGILITEVACAVLYLIPQTAVLGAILVTGYLGGAVATHLRVGQVGEMFMPALFGVVAWLGLWFRDARVRSLAPFRSAARG